MNPYDSRATAAVWQRVKQCTQTDQLEQALSEAIANEYHSRDAYLAMARCGFGGIFRTMAAQEACHARQLSALYSLLFECPPCENGGCPPKFDSLCQAVRMAFQGEKQAEKSYNELAQRYSEHAKLFCRIARQEAQHAERLQCIMQSLLYK